MQNKFYLVEISILISFGSIGFELTKIEDAKDGDYVGDFDHVIIVPISVYCGSPCTHRDIESAHIWKCLMTICTFYTCMCVCTENRNVMNNK